MRKQGLCKIPLAQFVGNRFNIIFYDAAGVFYLCDHMIKFIEQVHGNAANRLLQAVLSGLKDPTILAGCRALGMTSDWPSMERIGGIISFSLANERCVYSNEDQI